MDWIIAVGLGVLMCGFLGVLVDVENEFGGMGWFWRMELARKKAIKLGSHETPRSRHMASSGH